MATHTGTHKFPVASRSYSTPDNDSVSPRLPETHTFFVRADDTFRPIEQPRRQILSWKRTKVTRQSGGSEQSAPTCTPPTPREFGALIPPVVPPTELQPAINADRLVPTLAPSGSIALSPHEYTNHEITWSSHFTPLTLASFSPSELLAGTVSDQCYEDQIDGDFLCALSTSVTLVQIL